MTSLISLISSSVFNINHFNTNLTYKDQKSSMKNILLFVESAGMGVVDLGEGDKLYDNTNLSDRFG